MVQSTKIYGNQHELTIPLLYDEPEDEITCDALSFVLNGAHSLLRNLRIISSDLDMHVAGKRLLYALDFSEIYAYLWPEKSRSQNRVVTRTLLENQSVEFVLPPGSSVELVKYLEHLAASHDHTRNQFEDWISRPLVDAFLKHFDAQGAQDSVEQIIRGYLDVQSDLDDLFSLDTRVRKLEKLNSMSNLVSIVDSVNELDDQVKKETVQNNTIFHECLYMLNLRRPGEPKNNFIDAHNYSLIYKLSSAHAIKNETVYFLVTSSPKPYEVFQKMTWPGFQELVPHSVDQSLVRDPLQVLYLAQFMEIRETGRRDLNSLISNLEVIIDHWQSRPEYKRYRKGKEKPSTLVKFPRASKYLQSLFEFRSVYSRTLLKARDAIRADVIAEENLRRTRLVDQGAVGNPPADTNPRESISTRIVMELFDKLIRQAVVAISSTKKTLEKLPSELVDEVDVDNVISKTKKLDIQSVYLDDFKCREIVVTHIPTSEAFATISIYDEQDYFSVWWPSKLSIEEFLVHVRNVLAVIGANNPQGSSVMAHRKLFNGVYLRLEDDTQAIVEIPFSKVSDLRMRDLLEYVNMRTIQVIRIATEFGDICYQFMLQSDTNPSMGFISHMIFPAVLNHLVHATSLRRISLSEIDKLFTFSFKRSGGTS